MSYQLQADAMYDPTYPQTQTHDPSTGILTYPMQGAINQTYEVINHMSNTQNNIRHYEDMKHLQVNFKAKEDTYKKQIDVLKSTINAIHAAQQNFGPTHQSELQTLYQKLSANPVGEIPPQIIDTQQMLTKKMAELQTQLTEVVAKNANVHNLNQSMFQIISKVYSTLNDASFINQPRTLEEATKVITDLNSDVEQFMHEIGNSFSPVLNNNPTN